MLDSLLGRKFTAKCKNYLKRVSSRVGLVRKKKEAMIGFLKNDIAHLLANGHEFNAFERMDGLIFEMNQVSCYNMIEQCCQSIRAQLPLLQKQSDCPKENVEAVATLIFAAARFSDLPELCNLRHVFNARYGSDTESSENKEFVAKVTTKSFSKDVKLRIMQDIAKEFSVAWDHKLFGQEKPIPFSTNLTERGDLAMKERSGVASGPGQDIPREAVPMPANKDESLTCEPLASSCTMEPPSFLLNKNRSIEKDGISSWERIQTVNSSAAHKAEKSNACNKHEAKNSRAVLNESAGRHVLTSRGDSELKQEVDTETGQVHRTSRSNNTALFDHSRRVGRKVMDETENVKPPLEESTIPSHLKLRKVEKQLYAGVHFEMSNSSRTTPGAKEDLNHHNSSLDANGRRQPKYEKVKNMESPYVKPNSACVYLPNASTGTNYSSQKMPNSPCAEKLVEPVKLVENKTSFELPRERIEVLKRGKSATQIQNGTSGDFCTPSSQQDVDNAAQEKKPLGSGKFGDDTKRNLLYRNPPYVRSKGHKSTGYMEGSHRTVSFDNSMYQHGLEFAALEKHEVRENEDVDIHAKNTLPTHAPPKASSKGKEMSNGHNPDLPYQGNFMEHHRFTAHNNKDLPKCDLDRDIKLTPRCGSGREIIRTKDECKHGITRAGDSDVLSSTGLPKYDYTDLSKNPGWDSARMKQTDDMERGDIASRNRMPKYDKSNAIVGNPPKRYPANKKASEHGYVRRKHATFTEFTGMPELHKFNDDYDGCDEGPCERGGDSLSQNCTRLRKHRHGSSSRKHLKLQASFNDEKSADLVEILPDVMGSRRHDRRWAACVIDDEDTNLDRILIHDSDGSSHRKHLKPQSSFNDEEYTVVEVFPDIMGSRRHDRRQAFDVFDDDEDLNLDRLLVHDSDGAEDAAGQIVKLRLRPKHPSSNYYPEAVKIKGHRSDYGTEPVGLPMRVPSAPPLHKILSDRTKPSSRAVSVQPEWWT